VKFFSLIFSPIYKKVSAMKQLERNNIKRNLLVFLAFQLVFFLMTGCTTIRMTQTPRSALEQRLEIKALERAVSQIPIDLLKGKRVSLKLFGLNTNDLPFVIAYFRVWLIKQGIQIVQGEEAFDLQLKVFLKVLAVDQTEVLLGTPEFNFLGIPIPAIAFYRHLLNRGRADLKGYVIDPASSSLLGEFPESSGKAKNDRFTVLFIISWTKSDLDKNVEKKAN
jgi:hypothetical protein